MKLYLVRHGETVKVDGVVQSQDNPLTEKGKQQAREAAKLVANLYIEHFYCSDILRAVQTAEIINEKLSMQIIADPRLRGMDGDDSIKGLTEKQVNEFVNSGKIRDPWLKQFENAKNFLLELKEKRQNNILIVGHNGTVRMFQCAVKEDEWIPGKAKRQPEIPNCEVVVIDTDEINRDGSRCRT